MLKNDMHVYLIDFGSAWYLDQLSGISIAGTPGYTAPEIAYRRASLRSDIYSLGAILFQLVTGKKPTERTSHSERFHLGNRVVHQGPNELWDLIKQMMEEEESDRPDSIADVQKELQKIANQPAAVPLEKGDASSNVAPARRSFLLGAIVGGIAGIILGAAKVGPLLGLGSPVPFRLIVGGKLGNEDVLLTEMYILLLQKAGYEVHDKSKLGPNAYVFDALYEGAIDLYPEFLLTGLARLGIPTTHNQQQDFQRVQQEFMNRYQVTWLDQAVKLSDNYCVAMGKAKADQLGIKSLSDLMQYIKQNNVKFALAVAPDGKTGALPYLQETYGLTLGSATDFTEEGTFAAVLQNKAQLSICYATDPLITQDSFVRLIDDKGAFPIDPPSPIIRTEILNRSPGIATVLNRLAPKLSGEVSTNLQAQVLQGRSPSDVAQDWLMSQGLL
jgi:glycine betaine/choline ABC-type transport system substrate-binding protein